MNRYLSSFWNDLAPQIRGDAESLAIALLLATCPESLSSPLGLFRLPVSRISEVLGIDDEKVEASIGVLTECRFLEFDPVFGLVFLREAAGHYFGEVPNLRDKHLRGLARNYPEFRSRLPAICRAFEERYKSWGEFFRFSETELNIETEESSKQEFILGWLFLSYEERSFTSAELINLRPFIGLSPKQVGQVLGQLKGRKVDGKSLVRSKRVSEGYLWRFEKTSG